MSYQTNLRIGVDSRTGERNLRRFEGNLDRVEKRGNAATHQMGRLDTAIKAAAASYVGFSSVRAIRGVVEQTAQLSEMADVANITGERFQELTKSFSDMAGVSESITAGGLRRFNRRLDLAREGTGAAVDTIDRLNISLEQDTESALDGTILKLQEMAETQDITGAASRLFGEDAGPRMAAAIRQGNGALDEQIAKLREQGRVIDNESLASARELNDRFSEITDSFGTEFAQVVVENAEAIESLAEAFASVTEGAINALASVTDFTNWLGEELASQIHGIADDDIVRLEQRAASLRATLERFEGPGFVPAQDVQEAEQELASLEQQIDAYYESQQRQTEATEENSDAARDNARATEEVGQSAATASLSVRQLTDELDALSTATDARVYDLTAQGISDIRDQLDPTRAEMRNFREQVDMLNRGVEQGILSPGQATQLGSELTAGLSDAATGVRGLDAEIKALSEAVETHGDTAGDRFASGFERRAGRIGDSLADALMTGDWDGVGSTIGAVVGAEISDVVADSFEDVGSGAGAALAGPGGAILGGVAGGVAGQAISDLLSSSEMQRGELAAIRQEQQFTGTVLGSIDGKSSSIADSLDSVDRAFDQLIGINRGMLDALRETERSGQRFGASAMREFPGIDFSGVGLFDAGLGAVGQTIDSGIDSALDGLGAITFGLSDIGAELLTLGNTDLLGGIGSSVFGGDQSLQDEGIRVLGGTIEDLIDQSMVQAFQTIKTDGGWLSSSSTDTETQRIGGAIEQQFSSTIEGMTDSLVEVAGNLHMNTEDARQQLMEFEASTQNISLMDLDAGQQQDEIEAFFSSMFDNMAEDLFEWTDRFQQGTEGLGETVTRLAEQNMVAEEAARQLGFALDQSALSAEQLAETSEDFIELVGGTEQLAQGMQQFTSAFLSESAQLENRQDQLTRALEQQNLALPDTRDGFRELMEAQDASTDSGQRNIATLLRVQGVADDFYSMLETRQTDAIGAVESAMQGLEREIGAVESAIDRLGGGTAQQEIARLDAVDTLRNALSTGDFTGVGDAAGVAADLDAGQFSSREQFERARGVTANLLHQVQEEGEQQLTEAERQVSLMEDANGINESQLAALERIERNLTGGSVPAFASGGSHAGGARIVGERGPEIEFTGPSRIASNSQSKSLLSMDEVVSELRALQQQIQRLNQYSYQTTKNTGQTSKQLRRWENTGQPPEREEL